MPGVAHTDQDKPTLLKVVLRVQGDFRRRLEPIVMTPLPPRHIPRIILWHKSAKILLPHRMFVGMIWNSTRIHCERPFRSYEAPFIVRA